MITFKSFEHKNIKYKSLLTIQKMTYQYICKFSMQCKIPYPNGIYGNHDINVYFNNDFYWAVDIKDTYYKKIIVSLQNCTFGEKMNKNFLLNAIQQEYSINWMINIFGFNIIEDLIKCFDILYRHINILKMAGL